MLPKSSGWQQACLLQPEFRNAAAWRIPWLQPQRPEHATSLVSCHPDSLRHADTHRGYSPAPWKALSHPCHRWPLPVSLVWPDPLVRWKPIQNAIAKSVEYTENQVPTTPLSACFQTWAPHARCVASCGYTSTGFLIMTVVTFRANKAALNIQEPLELTLGMLEPPGTATKP